MSVHSRAAAYLYSIGKDVLYAAINKVTGVVEVQLGDSVEGTADSDKAELWYPPGFVAIPAPPTKGQASCQAIAFQRGDHDAIVATRDTRNSSIYGKLKAGETCVFASIGQARTIYKADGSITHYTTADNSPGGVQHSVTLSPDGWKVVTQFGSITLDAAGITLTVGPAALVLTPAGLAKLMGTQASMQGSIAAVAGTIATCLGPAATPTPGAPSLTSAIHGLNGASGAPSVNVFISP